MMLLFDQSQREAFAAMVRAQELDERLAADEASRLASAWMLDLPSSFDASALAKALGGKLAGYNADLHAWSIRAQRATHAAARYLRGRTGLDFVLDDLRLGEYFLLAFARARGLSIRMEKPVTPMLEAMLERHPPLCLREGHEPFEFDLEAVFAGAGHGRDLPSTLGTLFVATMEAYLNPMIPVMRTLLDKGERVAVLLPPGGQQWANARRIPTACVRLGFEDLMTGHDLVEFRGREKQMRSWLARTEDRLATRFTSADADLWPLIAPDIHETARLYIPAAQWLMTAGRRLVDDHGVKNVVCARLRRCSESAIALGVQQGGGRCVVLPHGHVGERPSRRFIDGSWAWADLVCAWGEEQRRQILDKHEGVRPERVIVTGNPAWATLTPPPDRRVLRRRIESELGLEAGASLLVFATQADGFAQAAQVVRTVLASTQANLAIKVHPRENRAEYDVLATHPRVVVVAGSEPPLHDLLAAADATLTFHSTTNIESILLGTPVISCALGDLAGVDRLLELERWGLPLATDANALAAYLKGCDADPAAFRASLSEAMANAASDIAGGTDAPRAIAALIVGDRRRSEAA